MKSKQQSSKDVMTPMFMERKPFPPPKATESSKIVHANNLNQKLHRLPLGSTFKEVLDPDVLELERYAKKKVKERKAIHNLIKNGSIQQVKEPKPDTKTPAGLQLTEDGKLKDESGKIISIQE